jgi:DNA-directed RNA polymerase specialized sigma24 family protein
MSSREMGPEWVLSASLANAEARGQDDVSELAIVARRLWPGVQAHARKELTNRTSDDAIALATGVWESVLRSVAKTMRRSNEKSRQILNLEAYLFGAFHHRLNRALRKERRRREMIKHLPLSRDLERLRQAHNSRAVEDLDRSIQVKQTIESMDDWTRRVWMARQAGYSWKEIAKRLRLTEPQAKLRFRYAIGRLCTRFGNAS